MGGKKDNAEGKGQGQGQGPGAAAGPVICGAAQCKQKEARFGFCSVHFQEFKFGLIKKDGTQVPDYDKKIKHYEALQSKKKAA